MKEGKGKILLVKKGGEWKVDGLEAISENGE